MLKAAAMGSAPLRVGEVGEDGEMVRTMGGRSDTSGPSAFSVVIRGLSVAVAICPAVTINIVSDEGAGESPEAERSWREQARIGEDNEGMNGMEFQVEGQGKEGPHGSRRRGVLL
jgi:hypothetical protein